jgi:hypothetical protein
MSPVGAECVGAGQRGRRLRSGHERIPQAVRQATRRANGPAHGMTVPNRLSAKTTAGLGLPRNQPGRGPRSTHDPLPGHAPVTGQRVLARDSAALRTNLLRTGKGCLLLPSPTGQTCLWQPLRFWPSPPHSARSGAGGGDHRPRTLWVRRGRQAQTRTGCGRRAAASCHGCQTIRWSVFTKRVCPRIG